MAQGLILRAERVERYRSAELDQRLDRLEAEGRPEEIPALLDGKTPKAQLFAGATIPEEADQP